MQLATIEPPTQHVLRGVEPRDINEWVRMRSALWPDGVSDHRQETEAYFLERSSAIVQGFVLERTTGGLGGFIEINVRNYAEGASTDAVPYVEGWYVDPDLRGHGCGRRLIQAAEQWALAKGYQELASDAEIANAASIAAHQALGFQETDRIVCFVKPLK